MPFAQHVFGPCTPQVDTGASNAFEPLGVTEDGGTIEEEILEKLQHSDVSGPEAEADVQQMGLRVLIRFKLTNTDEAVLTKIKKLSQGGAAAEGAPGTPGVWLGSGSFKFKLYLPSALQLPWVFTSCRLAKNGIKESTEFGNYDLTIKAWRYISPTASNVSGTTIYTRAAPP